MRLVSKLRSLMEEQGINDDRELAQKAGVPEKFLQQLSLLKGYHLNINHLTKVCEALGLKSISDLIELEEDEASSQPS